MNIQEPVFIVYAERSSPREIFVTPWDTPPPTDLSPTNKRPSSRGRNWSEVEKARELAKLERRSGGHGELHKERGSGHGEHRERGSGHGEHRHRTERKESRSTAANRHHSSREGGGPRGSRARTTRRNGRTPNQTSKSDEGSGICGQDVSTPTNGPTRDQMDPASRMTVRLRNVENWDCLKQQAGPAGPASFRGEKIMLESDAESRPQELSTPSLTVSGRLKRIDSSDVSLSPEPSGSRRHGHSLRAMQRSEFGGRIEYDLPDFIDEGDYLESRENRDGNPECDIVVPDQDLIHPGN